jgi:PAS domain S-box-containing protein
MPGISSYRNEIVVAWTKFITDQTVVCSVRAEIGESWTRCYQAGVNYSDYNNQDRLAGAELQELLAEKGELSEIAQPFMANLYKFVRGSGFVVVLTDERGYILELFGDEDTLKNPMTRNFALGANWREEEIGTNAIGTALKMNMPIQVFGAEHYCEKHHGLSCSAAPIFDLDGRVIGILNISGILAAHHLHTLGMVVAAAEAIMAQISIRRKNQQLALANQRMTNIFNAMSEGVLMIDRQGIINQFNPAAKEILGKTEQEVLGMPIDRVFGDTNALTRRMMYAKEPYQDIELMVDTKKGRCHCLATGEPLTDERGVVVGAVIVLRPITQIQNLVNRFSGNYATLQFSDIVGESSEIKASIRLASLAATTNTNVLLQGESGTGKEIFAQAIHGRSDRCNGPFVALNCGVIPRELIGSELFGYIEGAFTGAKKGGKPGKFELASGGTVFLDEIGDMPLEQQVALLRVLQEKKVTRIGCDKVIPTNVRVICATNRNLLNAVEKGTFRQDLYYRLNVISITIPPLRKRIEDIPLLFKHFLDRSSRERGCNVSVNSEVIDSLKLYNWPGNVRELQNVVERAISFAESGVITSAHLPAEISTPCKPAVQSVPHASFQVVDLECGRDKRRKMAMEAERQLILALLSSHGGNVSMAARELGISRNTMYRKMRLYAIEN